jgi:putative transposase
MYLPGYLYHIVQRGNNREACFLEAENYQYYLELWKECSKRYIVHAYCLMTNHIHFLVTPHKKDSISRASRDIGSRYEYYFNKTYKRTGTLWEGRHKSSLVQSDRYLLTCCRHIEMNPVEAGMVKKPEQYKWSSYMANGWGKKSRIVHHREYLNLGTTQESRCQACRELFKIQIPEEEIHMIERASEYCQPVGDDRFRKKIEERYGMKTGQLHRGRPSKQKG